MLYARMLDNSFIKLLYKLREIPVPLVVKNVNYNARKGKNLKTR